MWVQKPEDPAPVCVNVLASNDCFGEVALNFNQRRNASIKVRASRAAVRARSQRSAIDIAGGGAL